MEQGGATVFPAIKVSVFPKKGTAAFWFNLKKSGWGDFMTRHAGNLKKKWKSSVISEIDMLKKYLSGNQELRGKKNYIFHQENLLDLRIFFSELPPMSRLINLCLKTVTLFVDDP